MRFKKSILIALFLCLLMIESVSASSDNDTLVSNDVSDDSQFMGNDGIINEESSNNEENILKKEISDINIAENRNVNNLNKESINEESDNSGVFKEKGEDNSVLKDNEDELYIYLGFDKHSKDSIKFMEAIKAEIGNQANVVIDYNLPDNDGLNNVVKNANNGVTVYISDFFSAGLVYNLIQYNLENYASKLNGACFVYYGTIPIETTNFIARAWDDTYSDERFAGLYSPYKYITEGGLSFIQANGDNLVKSVAERILTYAKNVDGSQLKNVDRTSLFINYVETHDFHHQN